MRDDVASPEALFEKISKIEKALNLNSGFQLMYSPWASQANPEVVFLSLNPSDKLPSGVPIRSVSNELGNSYELEAPNAVSAINHQVLSMVNLLGREPKDVLTGALVPFRSSEWKTLPPQAQEAGLRVGQEFWQPLLAKPSVKLILTCGNKIEKLACEWTGMSKGAVEKHNTHWGSYVARVYRNRSGKMLINMPHLSRFTIFGRGQWDQDFAELAVQVLAKNTLPKN